MEFISKHRRIFFIAIILLCAALMGYSAYYRTKPSVAEDILSYSVTPFTSAVNGISDWVSSRFAFFGEMSQVNEENAQLKQELDLIKIENERLTQIELDYIRLTELFQIRERYSDLPTTGVSIIAKNPGVWYDNFLIDKGRADSIEANMVVIGVGGLVGRVTEAGYNYAKVNSLIDDTFSVSAKSLRTDDLGIVKGDMKLRESGMCKMERIDVNADILPGDEIVTSNLGNIYPPGITIGIVKEVTLSPDALTKTATIEPLVDFKRLDVLLVITEIKDRQLIDAPDDFEDFDE